ncbi:MAG: TonB-dependent receptor plug domain-containing protein [Ignavibacteria bacterium]|nr:TonB-dependent receptor plug domain-containing protein [Ignavibacteria bacterium]
MSEAKTLSKDSRFYRYDSSFVWADSRDLSEAVSRITGSYVFRFNNGGRNSIYFNGISDKETGIFRDGVQINDVYFGGFDVQSQSVNDIERIEEISAVSSFIYGPSPSGKSFNIITKDKLHRKPFSQFRYSQDRFNSLYADVFFSLPLAAKVNFLAGVTKHSIDGRYGNTEFDVWNGRSRLSYVPSDKLSIRADFYYNNISRGLNEGLDTSQTTEELADDDAVVRNPYSNEEIEQFNFGLTAGSKMFGKNFFTTLQVYSNNTLRRYSNAIADSSLVTAGFSPSENFHYISNSVRLSQEGSFRLSRNSGIRFYGAVNAYMNRYDKNVRFSKEDLTASLKGELYFGPASVTLLAGKSANNSAGGFSKGAEFRVTVYSRKNFSADLFGGLNETRYDVISYEPYSTKKSYYEAGFRISASDQFSITQTFFSENDLGGLSTDLHARVWNIFADAGYSYSRSPMMPEHLAKFDLSYRGFLFRNKLNLRAGFSGNYLMRKDTEPVFDQKTYEVSYMSGSFQTDQFSIDAYIGARIGRANINLTLANIFDSFAYGAQLYPLDNRGGFLNSVSRFTIVWDFID